MSKAHEITEMWKEIRPQMEKMINLCHQIESHAELHDNVTADAFQKGYDAAWEDIQPKIDAAYQKGLNDLWEAVQKVIKMYCEIDNEVFLRVFYDVKCDWGESVLQALFKSTPKHLIDSIREYEERKTKVEYNFEEVKDVIETTAKEYNMSLDEIAAVLQKMRGSE